MQATITVYQAGGVWAVSVEGKFIRYFKTEAEALAFKTSVSVKYL